MMNAEKVKSQYGKYLFVYFVGNGEGEERLHFAVSENGYDFKPLNNNEAVITQTMGKKCVRDPMFSEVLTERLILSARI